MKAMLCYLSKYHDGNIGNKGITKYMGRSRHPSRSSIVGLGNCRVGLQRKDSKINTVATNYDDFDRNVYAGTPVITTVTIRWGVNYTCKAARVMQSHGKIENGEWFKIQCDAKVQVYT